ncbi:hypothetical protein [Algibacter mikhailovii]|uniref:Uncharacterized protein n=1 Tax=Algibacter mikhailovii TaxID=425498 RepID=A0A918QUL7_9FLAO|nr:hypothetical protein [Algibacter mikhailovii]GGZ70303.1 hypothetical protein GCM10007028_04260 [Algibacter mikhailovii]
MIKFLKNILIFLILSLLVGEVIVRVTHSVSDIPHRKIDKFGIQKHIPFQTGFWLGGGHKWTINKLGWPGDLPRNFDNLITIIGDSFVENLMNPDDCRQSVLLKEQLVKYNFMEAGRSGVSFIEAFEISKSIDTLNPKLSLIYVNTNDFFESIKEIRERPSITQWSIETNKIVSGKIKSPGLKKILYNWKLLYYLYTNFKTTPSKSKKNINKQDATKLIDLKFEEEILALLKYTKNNHNMNNNILVFHPNTNQKLIDMCIKEGFRTMCLRSKNYKSWCFDYDKHWTCFGHRQAAQQVSVYLKNHEFDTLKK